MHIWVLTALRKLAFFSHFSCLLLHFIYSRWSPDTATASATGAGASNSSAAAKGAKSALAPQRGAAPGLGSGAEGMMGQPRPYADALVTGVGVDSALSLVTKVTT